MTGLSILSSLSFLFIQAGGLQQRKQQSQQRRDYRTAVKGLEQKVSPQHSTEPPPLLLVLETHAGVRQILPHDPTLFQSLFTRVCRSSQIGSVGIWLLSGRQRLCVAQRRIHVHFQIKQHQSLSAFSQGSKREASSSTSRPGNMTIFNVHPELSLYVSIAVSYL